MKLYDIVKDLKNLEEYTIQCMKCGICQSVCPLYEKDGLEQSVSRGKISLIELIFEGKIDKTKGVLKYLDYCILCGRCKRYCPSGVKTDEIFLMAKNTLRKINKLPLYQTAIIKTAIEYPELIDKLEPLLNKGLKIVSKEKKNDFSEIKKPINKNIPLIKKESFISIKKGLNRANNEKFKVIFYPGCAINYLFPHWGKHIIEILNMYGISVYVPEKNLCCGIPAATMGKIDTYKKMVNKNLNYFRSIPDAKYIITACPTCQWGLFDLGKRITKQESPIPYLDIIVFLEEVLKIKLDKKLNEKATLHIPCHYNHSKDETLKNLLSRLSNDFSPLDNQSCCGFGGTFSLKFPDDSVEIGQRKMEEIKNKNYQILYSPCPGCVMQLTDLTIKNDINIKVEHPIESIYVLLKGEKNV